ncbi:hypothetical protein JJQ72_17490 [Paenibacillus sp. F411]|uniref:hypothetical protein n=1 Tax=Paenibacillus sp. F411 TaxID=2820239 RepID=UPI001AAE66BA|nr:hypothetical protein [Paenibacillus sp. F411]MBO2945775.1 hypothetical protein [Paenibacillus sp. F411]
MISDTIKKLEFILSDERNLQKILNERSFTVSRNYRDKSQWYETTYPITLKRYEDTRNSALIESWAERISWVFSWVAAIPAGGFDTGAMEQMSRLEAHYFDVRLENIDIESFMGDIYSSNHGETMFVSPLGADPTPIKIFVILADKIIHVNERWNNTLSTTTKLLHFTFPGLFPIYDEKIHNILFIGKTQNYRHYHAYLIALHQFLRTSPLVSMLKKYAEDKNVTLVRLIEMVLFSRAYRIQF